MFSAVRNFSEEGNNISHSVTKEHNSTVKCGIGVAFIIFLEFALVKLQARVNCCLNSIDIIFEYECTYNK